MDSFHNAKCEDKIKVKGARHIPLDIAIHCKKKKRKKKKKTYY